MKVTIGGDRLGSGSKMQARLHGYERSTHDLGNMWRSTMAAGTIVPAYKKWVLPGDSWDIDIDIDVKTLPTNGPLFGSYKVAVDFFFAPVRLYQGLLHMNATGIGNRMNQVMLPQIELTATVVNPATHPDIDNSQVNPSSLLAYLGIRGIGMTAANKTRRFNAIPILMYWEIYQQYYANKQEEIGAVLHTPGIAVNTTVDDVLINGVPIPEEPATTLHVMAPGQVIQIDYTPPADAPIPSTIMFHIDGIGFVPMTELAIESTIVDNGAGNITGTYNFARWGTATITQWRYRDISDINTGKPEIKTFLLETIDEQRKNILKATDEGVPYVLNANAIEPYQYLWEQPNGIPNVLSSQEGLGLKTYQSDIFNNWLETTWIDDINAATAIDTSGGSFTQDQLILAKKMYDIMNRVAIAGGSYMDWISAVYTEVKYDRCETPMYLGGLIKELVFQEVVSNSESDGDAGTQPLGTLAGKGILGKKHKGGRVSYKAQEHGYIMAVVHITPRIDYSQGNEWDMLLTTMDDPFKPGLDLIGFEDSINEQRAWWSTKNVATVWTQTAAGKIPAWINYMTSWNKTLGNFAIKSNQMFMTLNRGYAIDDATGDIKDLTTYIDPSLYNFIFAQTELDAQNFWVQIGFDVQARRKMSGKIMPNL